jgi:hypothetical protein
MSTQHNWEGKRSPPISSVEQSSTGLGATLCVRSAVTCSCDVFLYPTEEQANANRAFHNSSVYDLRPTPVPMNCREIGWE